MGLALHKIQPSAEIVGHDKEPSASARAKKMGAIDRVEWNLLNAVDGADLVYIATPALAVRDTLKVIGPYVKEGAIVTDTADTKEQVLRWAEEYLPNSVSFIGGDPLVLSGEGGSESAAAELFRGATYCLVPSRTKAAPEAVQIITALVDRLGAHPYFLDAAEHDGLMAITGHLPFLLAAALLRSMESSPSQRELHRLVSEAFRRTTRFPSGNLATYRDIAVTNRQSLVRWLDAYVDSLMELRQLIEEAGDEEIEAFFRQAVEASAQWAKPARELEELGQAFDEIQGLDAKRFFIGRLDELGRPPKTK
jgi:prephenate dehydrogenase